jgi:hypothetical protein
MTKAITRRTFGMAAGATGLALGTGVAPRLLVAAEGRVVVIGGGPGGAMAQMLEH